MQEVLEFGEENYYNLINLFLVYPVDLIVELADMGYPDFEVFSQYDIFIMLYRANEDKNKELLKFLLGDVDFVAALRTGSEEVVLYDKNSESVFDLTSYMIMSNYIKTIHHVPEDPSKTARKGKMLKKTLIEVGRQNRAFEREQAERDRLSGKSTHRLQKYITKLCVASNYSRGDFYSMRLYEFYEILNEVVSYQYWKFKMFSVFTGNVDTKKMNKKELDWFFN